MKVVLIEDDKDLSEMFVEALKKEDLEIKVAFDGEEGLELIKSETPDIVLLDVVMPKKSGFEVLEEMKKTPGLENMPVIILTVLNKDDDIKNGLQLGAEDYIVKSQHTIANIVNKVQKVINDQ